MIVKAEFGNWIWFHVHFSKFWRNSTIISFVSKQRNLLRIRGDYENESILDILVRVRSFTRMYARKIDSSILCYELLCCRVQLLLFSRRKNHDGCLLLSCLWAHQNDNWQWHSKTSHKKLIGRSWMASSQITCPFSICEFSSSKVSRERVKKNNTENDDDECILCEFIPCWTWR